MSQDNNDGGKEGIIVVGRLACRMNDCHDCEDKNDSDLCLKLKAEKAGIKVKEIYQ